MYQGRLSIETTATYQDFTTCQACAKCGIAVFHLTLKKHPTEVEMISIPSL